MSSQDGTRTRISQLQAEALPLSYLTNRIIFLCMRGTLAH